MATELKTDDFNKEQKGMFAEAQAAETELQRAKYMVAVFTDRRDFLLAKLVESVEASKDKDSDDSSRKGKNSKSFENETDQTLQ